MKGIFFKNSHYAYIILIFTVKNGLFKKKKIHKLTSAGDERSFLTFIKKNPKSCFVLFLTMGRCIGGTKFT